MVESLITMSIAGFLTGFIFSMPIAGPISIMITSNALKGRLRYCNLFNLGASFGDFIYVFIAVFGLTKLYTFTNQLFLIYFHSDHCCFFFWATRFSGQNLTSNTSKTKFIFPIRSKREREEPSIPGL